MANTTFQYDVVVIGGGPAGLQATLTLARVHRRVLMLDSGSYRNAPAEHMHNFLTRDGTPPEEFRTAAHKELAAYDTVTVRHDPATAVVPDGDGFGVRVRVSVGVEGGEETLGARGVILATGLRDTLPDTPGLAELFGSVVAHCPFCHGHEFAGRPIAVVGEAAHIGRIMEPVASSVTILAQEQVAGLERAGDGARVLLTDGSSTEFGGVFVATALTQAAPFADQLGLHMLSSGCVEVDVMGRTSLRGVHAAGDMAHVAAMPMPMQSVLVAAASGQLAAGAMVAHLLQ
ncbi:NAD(P)/FAD-dependent oxidoreductase [Nocardioides donggukensis]|uniref:NAD(P)/FAD-dependent oxidoreductase n=1 Tax=Nocardioides donggukensis TaxID=2774019 RepID=A0A927K3D1_9ACTN|nr:NAD(P)/FAD-dependent oxidoreductase [Nocardioides donggukensis]MBD8868878.1 NAD(P)/FAD-dependent oxidoreductase [Nocardioides donggukensis]